MLGAAVVPPQSELCRICLETFSEVREDVVRENKVNPCRCKAPVHRDCLDTWRTAGINPANLTRCEVCQYHYRLERSNEVAAPWNVHCFIYLALFAEILTFVALAAAFGQLIKATNVVDLVDWGRLTFMKPDTARGWLFMGCCFNCFLLGVFVTLAVIWQMATGRFSRRAPEQPSRWSVEAQTRRRRGNDCCRDCLYTQNDSCWLYCYLWGPDCYCPCEGCCTSCDVECAKCCDCSPGDCGCSDCGACGGCGECGDNPLVICLFAVVIVAAVLMIVIGMFFFFWAVLFNVFYGLRLNHSLVRGVAAQRYIVAEYDGSQDEEREDLAWGAMLEAPPQKVQPKVKVAPPQPEPESVPPKVRMGKVYAEEDNGTSEVPAKKIQSSASRSSGNSRAARAISPRTA